MSVIGGNRLAAGASSLKRNAEGAGDARIRLGLGRFFADGERGLRGNDGARVSVIDDIAGNDGGRIAAGAQVGIVLE
jgi:hypothetical protein